MPIKPMDPDPYGLAAPMDPLAKAAARAARARKRKWIRRLTWTGAILALLLVIGGVLALSELTGSAFVFQPATNSVYADSLTTNAAYWPDSGGCGEQDGAYHVAPINTQDGESCFAPAGRFAGLDEQVTATRVAGPSDGLYGLVFRAQDGGDEYLFVISSDGVAGATKVVEGQVAPLAPVWHYNAGDAAQSHTLRAVAQGSTITCYVDGVQVGTLNDSAYVNGAVGLFAGSGGMDVAFTDFSVKSA